MGSDDGALLDHVVVELREIERRSGLERTLAIGRLVLESFFGGDPRAWRDRRRNKNTSIRRLASRKDCPFCRSALNDAVGVFVVVSSLPCVRTFGHISSSHVAAVLKLPEPERESVLRQAEAGQWSVRQLRGHVSRCRAREERGELPTGDDAGALAAALRACIEQGEEYAARLCGLDSLSDAARSELEAVSRSGARLIGMLDSLCREGPTLSVARERSDATSALG